MVGWVRWSSAHRSISSVVVALACKMTPNSSLPFLYRMLLIIVWYVPDYHIRVCYWECEIRLFVFIYRIFSQCLISIELPVWPTHDLLHILHCNLCIRLEFILFCGGLSHSWLYMALHVRNAMFNSVRLNRLVTLCTSGLWYVKVIHFFLCVCVGVIFVFVSWLFCSLNCGWYVMENRYSYYLLLLNKLNIFNIFAI